MKPKITWPLALALAGIFAAGGCGGGGATSSISAPAAPALTMYSSSANFGDVAVGASRVVGMTFANTGGGSLTLQQTSVTGAGFSTSGIGSGVTLTAGQYVTLIVTFNPPGSGQATGTVSLTSNSSSAPINLSLSGNGIVPAHTAAVNWNPSTSAVVGYNVYRNSVVDGAWTRVNSVPVTTTAYSDWDVQSGVFYLYSVKSVSSSNVESSFSVDTPVAIP